MNQLKPANRLLLARGGGFGDNLKWLRDAKVFCDAPPQANPFARAEREGKAEKKDEMS